MAASQIVDAFQNRCAYEVLDRLVSKVTDTDVGARTDSQELYAGWAPHGSLSELYRWQAAPGQVDHSLTRIFIASPRTIYMQAHFLLPFIRGR